MTAVVIYGRPECHLCDEAAATIAKLNPHGRHQVHVVNIEQDDVLHRRYLELIPVIEVDGVEVSRLDGFRGDALKSVLA